MKKPVKKGNVFITLADERQFDAIEKSDVLEFFTANDRAYLLPDGRKLVSETPIKGAGEIQLNVETGEITYPDIETINVKDAIIFGFQNLHTTDGNDGKGDGVWYPLVGSNKTRHANDPVMSLAQAKAMGLTIGS